MEAFWNMAPVMIMQCNDVTTAATKRETGGLGAHCLNHGGLLGEGA